MAITYNTNIVRSGLVLHLDAANPKSYPGSGTAWRDLSGNGNNGTLTNGPTYSSSNKGSIIFDSTDDYVSIPISCNKTYYSLNWWIYPTTRKNYNQTMSFNNAWGAFFMHTTDTGGIYIGTDVATRMTPTDIPANTLILNTWQNFTYTFNNGVGTFYKNGTVIATKASMNISSATFNTFYIGNIGSTNTVSGGFSTLGIYSNKVLSITEVQQNFEALRGRFGV